MHDRTDDPFRRIDDRLNGRRLFFLQFFLILLIDRIQNRKIVFAGRQLLFTARPVRHQTSSSAGQSGMFFQNDVLQTGFQLLRRGLIKTAGTQKIQFP